MTLIPVTPPAATALDRQAVWDHLPLDYEAGSPLVEPFDAATVDAYIEAAISHVDGNDGWLGRALITQEWDYTLDAFPCDWHGAIAIPLPPLQSVTSINYVDGHGATQLLPADKYATVGAGGWAPARITPATGLSWPQSYGARGGLTIRFTAGYGDSPADIPAAITQALKLLIGGWYRNRESVVIGTIVADLPFAVTALLQPFRVFR